MQPPELMNMFSVPFAFSRHPEQDRLNSALKRYIAAQEKAGPAAANPRPLTQRNAAVFESHFNLFRDNDPAIQELKGFCWNQLLALAHHLSSVRSSMLPESAGSCTTAIATSRYSQTGMSLNTLVLALSSIFEPSARVKERRSPFAAAIVSGRCDA